MIRFTELPKDVQEQVENEFFPPEEGKKFFLNKSLGEVHCVDESSVNLFKSIPEFFEEVIL